MCHGPVSALDALVSPLQLYSDHPSCSAAIFCSAVQTSPLSRAGREATSMRSTNGSGCLGEVSPGVSEIEEGQMAVRQDGTRRGLVKGKSSFI